MFYVSSTNQSGTIYRGRLSGRERRLEVWQPATPGNDGRGIEVDRAGRVFVAGGPAAEVRVFDRRGALLAELPTGVGGSYLNDLWIGPDGAAYVTDSSLPVIWRVSNRSGHWRIDRFLDVSGTIAYTPPLTDFDLGGITLSRSGRYLLTTQGTTGQLWRIDLWTRRISEVDLGGTRVVNADGIVLRGHTLYVVQNFSRQISKLRLGRRFESGTPRACPADARRSHVHDGQAGRADAARCRLQVRLPGHRGGRRGPDRGNRYVLRYLPSPRSPWEGVGTMDGLTRRQALTATAAAASAAALARTGPAAARGRHGGDGDHGDGHGPSGSRRRCR